MRSRRIDRIVVLVVLCIGLLPGAFASAGEGGRRAESSGLAFEVVAPPRPVLGTDRRRHLAYEIVIENPTKTRVRLERLVVRDQIDRDVFQTLDAGEIKAATFRYTRDGIFRTRSVAPGGIVAMLLNVRLGPDQDVPSQLEHKFTTSRRQGGERRTAITLAARTPVENRDATRLSPPLREDELAVFGCCDAPFAHRLALIDLGRGINVAQRFAIDYVQVNEQLETYEGDQLDNESYFIYGDELVAAAPGRVVATRNTMAENTPGSVRDGMQIDDATGNFVTLDLGNGEFALYAHLKTGSVAVEPGDTVTTGQVIGLVGNSGNSSEPHLHFHFMDGDGGSSGLDAEGIPYVFDSFRYEARIGGLDQSPPAPAREPAPLPMNRSDQLPLNGDIVSFSE